MTQAAPCAELQRSRALPCPLPSQRHRTRGSGSQGSSPLHPGLTPLQPQDATVRAAALLWPQRGKWREQGSGSPAGWPRALGAAYKPALCLNLNPLSLGCP